MKHILRLFHTIKYLKFVQIWNRIIKLFPRYVSFKSISIDVNFPKRKLNSIILAKQSLIKKNTFIFLNKIHHIKTQDDWNKKNIDKLWLYNLHYFNDLNAVESLKRTKWHYKLIQKWIDENPYGKGNGWEPYPLSLRVVNWIKYFLLKKKIKQDWKISLALQIRYLSKNLEYHLLGNHLLANAKALIFGGLYFKGKEAESWYKKGMQIFNDELEEQVLPDGGNFELSPMYHSIFLEDLLDLLNIFLTYNIKFSENLTNKIVSMLRWLELMTHPDGEISFFNDSTIGIASNFNELLEYANRLGINYESHKNFQYLIARDSGYFRLSNKNATAIVDVAKIGPDYLPAHSHADTLSFELSLFQHRVLVNCGTSVYEKGLIREYERSTKAHNTVVINDQNSSEVWDSFRVAKRAYTFDYKFEKIKKTLFISCKHNGYKRLKGRPVHQRNWQFSKNFFIIEDRIAGSFKNAFAYFHIHPSINIISNEPNKFVLNLPNKKQVNLFVEAGESKLKASTYASQFGKRLQSYCIEVKLIPRISKVKITWKNNE